MQQTQIWYGGDYCPEQWDTATLEQDIRHFKEAGVNLVTLATFGWAKMEPSEGVYDFFWLDQLLDRFGQNGIGVCLATGTAAQPAWLSTQYPQVLPVDIAGRKRTHGMRMFFCVNSEKYRERAAKLAEQLSLRYHQHPALVAWHVCNEYGTYCYCPTCQAKFRQWLKARYGSIEALNQHWYTAFWGRQVTSFDEIMLPTELNDDYRFYPIAALDYMRFVTDSTIECYNNEADVLRRRSPDIPIFSNMSGFIRKLDQFKMNEHMDLAGWDNYPTPGEDMSLPALKHDLMRALKQGRPYWVVEQSPNQQNWQPYNKLKRPGEVRRIAYQGIARGADACLYFQMRQSRGGQEQYHGALLSHAGTNDTRIFREMAALGQELRRLGDMPLNGRIRADIGMLFDWDNWWAQELASGPSADLDYLMQVHHHYKPFYHANLTLDIVQPTGDLGPYRILVAPLLYMLKAGVAERIAEFVRAGGTLIATYLSGYVDEDCQCNLGAFPGGLREVLGLSVEETDALFPHEQNVIDVDTARLPIKARYTCRFLCDLVRLEGAEALATYGEDFYHGFACVTRHAYGAGEAYYLATQPDDDFLRDFIGVVAKRAGVQPRYRAAQGVEVVERGAVTYAINHTPEEKTLSLGGRRARSLTTGQPLSGEPSIAPGDVLVFEVQ